MRQAGLELFDLGHFAACVDREAFLLQTGRLRRYAAGKDRVELAILLDHSPVGGSVVCIVGDHLEGFLGRDRAGTLHIELARELLPKQVGRQDAVVGDLLDQGCDSGRAGSSILPGPPK